MKKVIFIGFGVIIVIICSITYYLKGIDTKYAKKYAQIFGSFDIKQVDQYLDEETIITYNGTSRMYKHLRENVIAAFEARKFKMLDGSSYGSGNNKFANGVQEVNIQSYVSFNNKSLEESIIMELEIIGLNKFKVKSLSSNDNFFGYLFFGIDNGE